MTPVTSPIAVACSTSACTAAREDTSGRSRADLEPGIAQHLGRSLGVLPAEVGQQHMLAGADPSRDGLADQACVR